MKKITLSLILLICGAATAKNTGGTIDVKGIEMIRSGQQVILNFTMTPGPHAVKSDYNLIVIPSLQGESLSMPLPSVAVQGRKAKMMGPVRYEQGEGNNVPPQIIGYTTNGTAYRYSVAFPYSDWMRGSDLVFDGVLAGCCTARETPLGLIAENVLCREEPPAPVMPVAVPPVTEPLKQATAGERLAARYPFIATIDDLRDPRTGHMRPLDSDFIEGNRDGSVTVYFRQGKIDIDRSYMGNNDRLAELISTIRTIQASSDSRIAHVVIAGFASPEGTLAMNQRLSGQRAAALRNFLMQNTSVTYANIDIYNGEVDWPGLRKLVERSNMPDREIVLSIIDNTPIWDAQRQVGRQGTLMSLRGGEVYRYMYHNFFPQLRNAAYIRVYYENK